MLLLKKCLVVKRLISQRWKTGLSLKFGDFEAKATYLANLKQLSLLKSKIEGAFKLTLWRFKISSC